MIVPHSHKRIREITISQRTLLVAAFALVVAVLLSLTYAIGFHIRSNQRKELEKLKLENMQLTSRISDMSAGVVTLKTQLDELTRKEEILRVMANLPQMDSETRMMGIGGLGDEDDPLSADALSQASRLGMEVHADIEQLLRQTQLQRQNFELLERAFNDSIEFRDHLPSIWPVSPSQVYISSYFGPRIDPFTGRRSMHKGVDLAGRTGTPIMATANGVVANVAHLHYIGKVIEIDHLYGYSTYYGHLSKTYVRKGQRVTRGQIIGELGNTGRSTGPHLHYSVSYNGRQVDPLDFFYDER